LLVQGVESLPLADMEGMLERKHLHQSGGKLATLRSWKTYYTVLAGQLLCFFKDQHGSCFSTFDTNTAWSKLAEKNELQIEL